VGNLFQKSPVTAGILVGGGLIMYFGFNHSPSIPGANQIVIASSTIPTDFPLSVASIATQIQPPSGHVEYRNETYHFSLYHSPAEHIREYDEGGGAMTITLQNPQKIQGLQIFIVPYRESSLSDERFRRDVPSGIRANVENTHVAGVPAVTFVSRDALLGDTREVWFIHDGYLYEVTTLKGISDWLIPIMNTWRFL